MNNEDITKIVIKKSNIEMSSLTDDILRHFDVILEIDNDDLILSGQSQNLIDLLLYCCDMNIDKLNDMMSNINTNVVENEKVYLVKATSENEAIMKVNQKIKQSDDLKNAIMSCISFIDSKGGFEGYSELRSQIVSMFKK